MSDCVVDVLNRILAVPCKLWCWFLEIGIVGGRITKMIVYIRTKISTAVIEQIADIDMCGVFDHHIQQIGCLPVMADNPARCQLNRGLRSL